MPEIRHLKHAPITEAVVNFQADASMHWNPVTVQTDLCKRWTAFPEVQEIRPFEIKFVLSPDQPPQVPSPNSIQTEGFTFVSDTMIVQARRDGLSFVKRPPYEDWVSLERDSLSFWHDYHEILRPNVLHGLGVRFNNQLEFPAEDFKLSRYLTTPPTPPSGLGWGFRMFHQQAIYAPPGSPCDVTVTVARAFVADPVNRVAIALNIEVTLKESFTAVGRDIKSILSEMHNLKNTAFFSMLTEETIQLYL